LGSPRPSRRIDGRSASANSNITTPAANAHRLRTDSRADQTVHSTNKNAMTT